jgi:hypothetical protein
VRRDALVDAADGDGNTPLDPDELDGLLPPHLRTRADDGDLTPLYDFVRR